MYEDFLKYLHDNNITKIDSDLIDEYTDNIAEYSDKELTDFFKECIEKREDLGLDSNTLVDLLCYIEDDDYVIKCIENRREEFGLKGYNIEEIVSCLNDENNIKRCILKEKEIGLNWKGQYNLLSDEIEDEAFKIEFMKNDKRSFTQINTAKLNFIVNENNEEFTKKCIEKYEELGLSSLDILLNTIKDEEFIKACIEDDSKYKLYLKSKSLLIAEKISDNEYKYNFILNNYDKDSFDYNRNIQRIIESIDDKGIIKDIIKENKKFNLFSDEIISLIKKTNDVNYIKECVLNWKKIGLYGCGKLILELNDEEFLKKCIKLSKELNIPGYEICMLLKEGVNDREYIKECIEKHNEINIDKYDITCLLEYLDDKEYTKSILLECTKYDLYEDDVINWIHKIEDEQFTKNFVSQFNKNENVGFGWQEDCKKQISDKNKVILSSPTGSGKTRVFLEWAMNKEERPIYITAPIKALSNQRYRELKEEGINVGIETGDIKNVPLNCDIICCTQEIYTSKYTEIENATCIMDEFHYIFESEERARVYIDGLRKSQAKNLLICSATFGNIDKFKDYVEKVSDEDFFVYKSDSRLTNLNYNTNIERKNIQDSLVIAFSNAGCRSICSNLKDIRKEDPNYSIDKSKEKTLEKLSKKYNIKNKDLLEYVKYGLAYYYGTLLPKEKAFIEELFENRAIDTVAGTDALAMGVNFPVQNVVFAQTVKYRDRKRISKNLFEQLSGRAGRKGFYDEGNVYFCDDFELEANGCWMEEEYLYLLLSENEDISIRIKPDIKAILKGEKTIEEENDFVNKFSTMETSIYGIIEDVIEEKNEALIKFKDDIENPGYEIDENEKEALRIKAEILSDEFEKNIGEVYYEGFDPQINFSLFSILIKNREGYDCQFEYHDDYDNYDYDNKHINQAISYCNLLDYLCKDNGDSNDINVGFRELMQMRTYINQLPKQYRHGINIMKLENLINEIDSTVLNQGKGSLSIEEIRDGISKQDKKISTYELAKAIKDVDIEKCDEASKILTQLLKEKEQSVQK